MISLSRGVWHYAALLIFLFAITSVVAWITMADLYESIPADEYQKVLNIASFRIWALTMGFMFMAGAFGIWAIQFSAETESRLRVSEIVESMDYLDDGLLVLDKRGRIAGSNPSAKQLIPESVSPYSHVTEAFRCLSDDDMKLLMNIHGPNEVQHDVFDSRGRHTLRFRSQTAGGIVLILVGDVTVTHLHELRAQQIGRFQLIGRIARGVANDFNSILTGIAGYASLISRLDPGSKDMKESLATIAKEAERGALLAAHLLEFSHMSAAGRPTENLAEHVAKAADLIRVGLASEWKVETSIAEDIPVVPLSGLQIQQIVLNLGLIAADAIARPGVIRVTASRSGDDHLSDIGDEYAAAIIVSAAHAGGLRVAEPPKRDGVDGKTTLEEAGVIQSVVRSLVEESGGILDFFTGADGSQIYRIVLPYGTVGLDEISEEALPEELQAYISHWQVMLARPTKDHDFVEEKLREMGVSVERVDNIMTALARVETGQNLHAIVVEKGLLGGEAAGLLRAMVKLCPGTGIVVLCEDPAAEGGGVSRSIVFVSRRADPTSILKAMVEAKGLAAQQAQ